MFDLVRSLFFVSFVWAISFPSPVGLVNDFAKVLAPATVTKLETQLQNHQTQTGQEIAIVTVSSLEGQPIENYANELFRAWGIGQKNKDNGLLLLVAPKERQVRIEVGYGLEGIINDGRAGSIIRNQITPYFKQNNYDQGVQAGVDQILSYLQDPNQADQPVSKPTSFPFEAIPFLLYFLLIFASYIFSFLGRTRSWHTGGILGFLTGSLFGLFFHRTLLVGGLIGGLGLLLDFILSRNYKYWQSKGLKTNWLATRGGFWASGSGGSSSSGSSFGGFGGGSSGGGGASGSW